jgi:fumarylacetoacetase
MPATPDPARDPTLDPSLRSWVDAANDPESEFPIQNLPLCRFLDNDAPPDADPGLALAIGDRIVVLSVLADEGVLPADLHHLARRSDWTLGPAPRPTLRRLRESLQAFLRADADPPHRALRDRALRPLHRVRLVLPTPVPDYTDFYAGIHHAANVGAMFRPDNPLLPNYKHVPIGYHGRASSVVISGTDVTRPSGQHAPEGNAPPAFAPTRMLDYELEVGAIIARGNPLGQPIPIARALDHVLGLCLVNDWSARDIQRWEYQPLGPFLAKNFATTISPFIVTLDALAPFRCPAMPRPPGDPRPLPYLLEEADQAAGGFDITLEVHLRSAEMIRRGLAPVRLSSGSFTQMYWTFAQMIAHHTSNGCNLRPGDLLASGTVSGPDPASRGCLLELTWQGHGPDGKPLPRKPIQLPTGEQRTFLEDGDEVTFHARCQRDGFRTIGFGACSGTVRPAVNR